MKKFMMLLVAMMLMVGFTGQAMAAFSDGDLIRVVYSTTGGMETATDLGSISALTSASTANVNYNTNNFSLNNLGAGADASNSYVAYYSLTLSPNPKNQAWISGAPGGQSTAKGSWTSYYGAAHNVNGMYQVAGGGVTGAAQVTVSQSDPNSFWNQMERTGSAVGKMNNFVTSANATASLAGLSTNGYVDQTLYYYGAPSGLSGSSTGVNVSTIRTFADGHTELNPTTANTPIPAAFLLFGSGLLGLVGIRRKHAA